MSQVSLSVTGGVKGDIPVTDTVRVAPAVAERVGPWGLLVVEETGLKAPVRVEGLERVGDGYVEIAYALRTFLDVRRDSIVSLGEFPPASVTRLARVQLGLERAVERLLNAPPIALRAVEGLVGDDALPVVRVDSTALEYIGLEAGEQGYLTWGTRHVEVRVLLQTALTIERMELQLSEATGHQLRPVSNLAEQRAQVPPHLRVWVSSTVREELGIESDTVVRLRRSVLSVIGKHLLRLAAPLFVLLIGFVADQPPWFWWVAAGAAVLTVVAAFLPLRMPSPGRVRPIWIDAQRKLNRAGQDAAD